MLARSEERSLGEKVEKAYRKAVKAAGPPPPECSVYQGWRASGFNWTIRDYTAPGFYSTYTSKLLYNRAIQLYRFLEDTRFKDWVLARAATPAAGAAAPWQQVSGAKPEVHITSLGCGPGTDAVSLVAIIKQLVGESLTVHVTLIDRVKEWRDIAKSAVDAVLSKDDGDTSRFLVGTWDSKRAAAAAVSMPIGTILCESAT
jgi:hypothetical protein